MAGQGPKAPLSASQVQTLVDKQPNWNFDERTTLEGMMGGYFKLENNGQPFDLKNIGAIEQSVLNHLPAMHGIYQDYEFLKDFQSASHLDITKQDVERVEQLFQRYHPETYGDNKDLIDGKYSVTEQGHATRLLSAIVGEMKNTQVAVRTLQAPLKPQPAVQPQKPVEAQRRAAITGSKQPEIKTTEVENTNITTEEAMAFPSVRPQGVDVSFVELTYDDLISRYGANDGDSALFKFEETGHSYLVSKNDAGEMEFRDVTGKNITDATLTSTSKAVERPEADITHKTAPIIPVRVEPLEPLPEKQIQPIQKPEMEQAHVTEGIMGRAGEIDNARDYLRDLPADDVVRMQEKLGVDDDGKWGEKTMTAAAQYIDNNDLPQNTTFGQLRDEMGIGYNAEVATGYAQSAAALLEGERPKQEFTEKGGQSFPPSSDELDASVQQSTPVDAILQSTPEIPSI